MTANAMQISKCSLIPHPTPYYYSDTVTAIKLNQRPDHLAAAWSRDPIPQCFYSHGHSANAVPETLRLTRTPPCSAGSRPPAPRPAPQHHALIGVAVAGGNQFGVDAPVVQAEVVVAVAQQFEHPGERAAGGGRGEHRQGDRRRQRCQGHLSSTLNVSDTFFSAAG